MENVGKKSRNQGTQKLQNTRVVNIAVLQSLQ